MPVYAIGDVQGCFDDLNRLLEQIAFDPDKDQLWFAGDLVNRGPKSLETLRFVRSLGDRAVSVLGNHDLHLLAAGYCPSRNYPDDTLKPILSADDCDELLDWLRNRPLLYRDTNIGFTLIHAGLPPQWTIDQASEHANEVEDALRGDRFRDFLEHMYGNKPGHWDEKLAGFGRLRFITNCFTRLRYCTTDGQLELKEKGPPGSQKPGAIPWFEVGRRRSAGEKILFGHWSTLGPIESDQVFPLDTGCLWGGHLTALELGDKPRWHHCECPGAQDPVQFI